MTNISFRGTKNARCFEIRKHLALAQSSRRPTAQSARLIPQMCKAQFSMAPGKMKVSTPRHDAVYQKPYSHPKQHTTVTNPVLRQLPPPVGSSPWKPHSRHYSHGVIGLHEELVDFHAWIVPSAAEKRMRQHVVDEVSQTVKRLYPHARIDTFGSFQTGLYLPSSDLDLIIFGKWPQLPFYTLQEELIKAKICTREGVKILDKASVPILKIVHEASGLKVDMSFNMVNGLHTAKFISQYTAKYTYLPKLFLFLKQFLYERDLNEVFTGGISSYALALMLISFFQMHVRINLADEANLNLGVLLLEFLELYGCHFNYGETTIRVMGSGSYITKGQMRQMTPKGMNPGILSIDDPVQPGNDIGRNCYGVMQVKQAFEYGFNVLRRGVLDPGARNMGILGRILKISQQDIEYRQWVGSVF